MKNILILGANGSLAKVVIPVLLKTSNNKLILFSRKVDQLRQWQSQNVAIVSADVLNLKQLETAIIGQDIVYANLSGELVKMAQQIVTVMQKQKVMRLIWISSMGIYDETSEDHSSSLTPYRNSAKIIEASNLNYTIIRPAWFTNCLEVNYQLTNKGDAFIGHSVSRISIASLIAKLIDKPNYAIRQSLGIAKPV